MFLRSKKLIFIFYINDSDGHLVLIEMEKILVSDCSEINLKNATPIYTTDLFIYRMILTTNYRRLIVDSMRVIYMFAKSNQHVVFRFINMNKYCRFNYKKFTDSYTQIDLYPVVNTCKISYYVYFIDGDEDSKEIIDEFEFDISECLELQRFFYFLYTKYKRCLEHPSSRI